MEVYSNMLPVLPQWPSLDDIKCHLVEQREWSEEKTDHAIEEYKKFMFIMRQENRDSFYSPPAPVDEIWHQHMLFTDEYDADLEAYIGHNIRHIPSDVRSSDANQNASYGEIYDKFFN